MSLSLPDLLSELQSFFCLAVHDCGLLYSVGKCLFEEKLLFFDWSFTCFKPVILLDDPLLPNPMQPDHGS